MSELYIPKKLKNVLLIVGNGFDLNIGLKTSYNNFLNSLDLEEINNNLIFELKIRNKTNWVDIEKELEDCAIHNLTNISEQNIRKMNFNTTTHHFKKSEYNELKSLLKDYLINEQKRHLPSVLQKNSYELLAKLISRKDIFLTILNFNYISTVRMLINVYIEYNHGIPIKNYNHIYVHGNLNDDIVFGVADNAKINKQHHYLLKSFDTKNNTKINISKLLNNSDEIFFYGYSLGETDTSYFDDFFKESCVYDDNIEEENKKKITFYHYKEEGYNDLFDRLFTLTDRNISKLTHLNNVYFIDSFE